jgi:hypothetical protein
MGSWVGGESSPARVVGKGMWVVVIVRGYQHQQTRAAAAREGCREMDATRKKSRPGGRGRDGVLEAVTGPDVVVDGALALLVVVSCLELLLAFGGWKKLGNRVSRSDVAPKQTRLAAAGDGRLCSRVAISR